MHATLYLVKVLLLLLICYIVMLCVFDGNLTSDQSDVLDMPASVSSVPKVPCVSA